MLNCMYDLDNTTCPFQKNTWGNKPIKETITDSTRGRGAWTDFFFLVAFSPTFLWHDHVLSVFLSAPSRKEAQTWASGHEPSLSEFTHVCTVLTFHVVQSVPQHLEHGHVEGVTERGVVEVSAGVSLWGRQRHVTTAPKPSSGPPPLWGDPVTASLHTWLSVIHGITVHHDSLLGAF